MPIHCVAKLLNRRQQLQFNFRNFLRLIQSHSQPKPKVRQLDVDSVGPAEIVNDFGASVSESRLIECLKSNVLFEDSDIYACYKPYGVSAFEIVAELTDDFESHMRKAEAERLCINAILPQLAVQKGCGQLFVIKTIPRYTSGVIILGKTKKGAERVRKSFVSSILKSAPLFYCWAICVSAPNPADGIERTSLKRMPKEIPILLESRPTQSQLSRRKVYTGIVQHNTLDVANELSLVELHTMTFHAMIPRLSMMRKGAPLLGDTVFQPQVKRILGKVVIVTPKKAAEDPNPYLPMELLKKTKMSPGDYLNLPMFFHVFGILLNGYHGRKQNGLFLSCPLPDHFTNFLQHQSTGAPAGVCARKRVDAGGLKRLIGRV